MRSMCCFQSSTIVSYDFIKRAYHNNLYKMIYQLSRLFGRYIRTFQSLQYSGNLKNYTMDFLPLSLSLPLCFSPLFLLFHIFLLLPIFPLLTIIFLVTLLFLFLQNFVPFLLFGTSPIIRLDLCVVFSIPAQFLMISSGEHITVVFIVFSITSIAIYTFWRIF